MAPRYYLKDASNDTVEVTDRIDRKHPPTLKENAEEGSVAMSTVILSDPGMDLDIHGLQPFWAIEDDSEATDDVLFGGFLAAQEISRGSGDAFEPLGRVWSCEIVDANSLWNRRVMTGSDNKRPAETDVARVQWLFTTAETGIWDDETTYVYTGSTHNMDKVDYRGQYRDQVIGDCAQASGKNWWSQLHETGTGREWFVWYGLDSETGYSSDLYLTNDTSYFIEADITDGTSTVWPISEDTRLRTDPQRVYSGVYLRYEKGAVYRHDSATTSAFCRRDYVADYPNVKSKTKAIARAIRLLDKLDTQDDRITTTVRLPKGKATMIRAGMRVPFLATHLPGYTTWQWLRVLSCAVTPTESGDDYDLALELVPTGQSATGPLLDCTDGSGTWTPQADGVYGPLNSGTSDSAGFLQYGQPGLSPSTEPDPNHVGGWNFAEYGSGGSADYAGDCASNILRVLAVGPGTITISTASYGAARTLTWAVQHLDTDGITVITDSSGSVSVGASIVGVIPDDGFCVHWVDVADNAAACGSKWGFAGYTWARA